MAADPTAAAAWSEWWRLLASSGDDAIFDIAQPLPGQRLLHRGLQDLLRNTLEDATHWVEERRAEHVAWVVRHTNAAAAVVSDLESALDQEARPISLTFSVLPVRGNYLCERNNRQFHISQEMVEDNALFVATLRSFLYREAFLH